MWNQVVDVYKYQYFWDTANAMFSKDKYFTLNDECSRFLSNDGNFLPELKVPYSATGMQ